MKSVFILLAILLLSVTGNTQQLDSFFTKNHDQYTIKNISAFYFEKEADAYQIVQLAKKNSRTLKEQDYYVYLMNELTRAVFIKHTDDIKGALQLLEKLRKDPFLNTNKKLKAYHNNVTGNTYFQMESYDKANHYYLKAIDQFKSIKDSTGWQGNLINAGNAYASQLKPDSAIFYYDQALHLDSLGIKAHHLGLISNLARYYVGKHQIEKATEMYEEVHDYAEANNDPYAGIISSLNLGDCYLELNQFEKAIFILTKGRQTAIDRSMTSNISNFERTLSRCYAATNDYNPAYYALYASDSIERRRNKRNLEEFAEKLSIKHQKAIREKEHFIYRQKSNQEKAEQKFLILSLTIATFLLLVILYLYFQKRKKNKILAKQNFKLVEKSLQSKQKNTNRKEVSTELIDRIEHYFSDKKKFRNSDLTLDKLAKSLSTNRTYLSENINAHYGFSFSVLLNKLRIDDARSMLVDEEFDHFSIEGIAISVGYRNLSSFNAAFKKESGITPSYFRNQNRKAG
ncbi:MAG: AraC-like DNA-binding protein [Crocinitomicaceae bacterium]|jgi:AraC-like DNA-binding protein